MSHLRDPLRRQVEQWLKDVVVGLNLCPFARGVVGKDTLRLVFGEGDTEEALLRCFLVELERLVTSSVEQLQTTLLLLPEGVEEFSDFLDFVDMAEGLLEEAGLESEVQLAHFHPGYLFAGEDPKGLSHWTNRAPCPILHLLRVAEVSRVIDGSVDTDQIPEENIKTLQRLTPQERTTLFPWLHGER